MISLGDLDFDYIVPRIGQGSLPPPGRTVARHGFDLLVLCAEELQMPAELFDGVRVLHVPLYDTRLTQEQWTLASQTAKHVALHMRAKPQSKALITCAAGRNRSGLVTAIALHLLTGQSGLTCARHVQGRRQNALTNGSFVEALRRLPNRR